MADKNEFQRRGGHDEDLTEMHGPLRAVTPEALACDFKRRDREISRPLCL